MQRPVLVLAMVTVVTAAEGLAVLAVLAVLVKGGSGVQGKGLVAGCRLNVEHCHLRMHRPLHPRACCQ